MSRFLKGIALLAGALLIQILVSHRVPWIQRSVDLVLLVVVFYGSSGSRVGAMTVGAVGGLLEDVWFGDLMGLHGFTKTLIGYLLGNLGSRFELTSPGARILAVLAATIIEKAVEPAVLIGLGVPATFGLADLAWRCAGNTLAGSIFFFALAGAKDLPPKSRKRRVVAT